MPKISSNNTVKIITDKLEQNITVDVYYSKDHKFFIKVPSEYTPQFDALEQNQRPDTRRVGNQYTSADKVKRLVVADSEKEVLENFKATMKLLASANINERPVIMLSYKSEDGVPDRNYWGGPEFPKVGLELYMTYCTELSLPGANPKYYKYRQEKRFGGEEETVKTEISKNEHWGTTSTIIDDTPENRAFLENIWINLKRLVDAMDKYTETPDALLELINSKQKLIG